MKVVQTCFQSHWRQECKGSVHALAHVQIRRHVHDDTQKKTHCRTVPFSNGGQLGCQRLLCLSGSMYVNVKKLSGNTNRGEEGRRRPIQGGLIQQHLPCSAMSHIQFHDDTSSATSSNMNHFTFCHSSSVYSLCPLLITAMTS